MSILRVREAESVATGDADADADADADVVLGLLRMRPEGAEDDEVNREPVKLTRPADASPAAPPAALTGETDVAAAALPTTPGVMLLRREKEKEEKIPLPRCERGAELLALAGDAFPGIIAVVSVPSPVPVAFRLLLLAESLRREEPDAVPPAVAVAVEAAVLTVAAVMVVALL